MNCWRANSVRERRNIGPRRPLLHAFIHTELARGEIPPTLPDSREGDVKALDRLLYETVMS